MTLEQRSDLGSDNGCFACSASKACCFE